MVRAALLVACVLMGCGGADALRSSRGVGVYVVVTRDVDADSTLRGLVVTLGSPAASVYREVDAASMTRRSDGAAFDLVVEAKAGSVPLADRFVRLDSVGNLALSWVGSGGRLGRQALQAGDVIDLEIETGDQTIVGSALVPAAPVIQVSTVGGVTTMSWPRTVAGGAFVLRVDTDGRVGERLLTADTSYVIRRDRVAGEVPSPAMFEVTALDLNTSRYLTDTTVVRAGIGAGYGVVGATARARVAIPEP